MDRNILFTYINKDGVHTYDWFEDTKELDSFIKGNDNIKTSLECYDCSNVRELDLHEIYCEFNLEKDID